MKNLIFLVLVTSFSVVSAFASEPLEPQISCSSNSGYYVNVFEKNYHYFAVLGQKEDNEAQLRRYFVFKTVSDRPGAPVKFVSPAGDFQLSICATCTPVDGQSTAKLHARLHGLVFDDFDMLCKMN